MSNYLDHSLIYSDSLTDPLTDSVMNINEHAGTTSSRRHDARSHYGADASNGHASGNAALLVTTKAVMLLRRRGRWTRRCALITYYATLVHLLDRPITLRALKHQHRQTRRSRCCYPHHTVVWGYFVYCVFCFCFVFFCFFLFIRLRISQRR